MEEKKIQCHKVMSVNHQQCVILPFTVNTKTQSIFNLYNMIEISVHTHGRVIQKEWCIRANKHIVYCIHCYRK